MRSSPVVFVIIFLSNVACGNLTRVEFEDGLGRLTDQIISGYFSEFKCLTFVTDDGLEGIFRPRHRPVFLVKLAENEPLEDRLLTESFEQGCGGYVIRIKSWKRFTVVRRVIAAKKRSVRCRYNNQRYLMVAAPNEGSDLTVMNHPDLEFLPNFILAEPNRSDGSNDAFVLRAHTAFDHHKRHVMGIEHEVVDYWSPDEGFRYANDLYPDRTKNVMGRKFVFGVLKYSPFSLVLEEEDGTVFDGFETRIVGLFVNAINGTWEGLDHPDLWGEAFPNATGTGVVGSILDRKADFGFSGFYQWFCEDVDCTVPFYQSGITCLVPRPNLVSEWMTIVFPFSGGTWFILIIAHFFNTLFFFSLLLVLQHLKGSKISKIAGTTLGDSFFTIFRIQLEQIPRMPKFYESLAVFVRILVFYYFFVAAFWQGGIASVLTVPRYEKTIDDTADLVNRWPKVQWGGNTIAWVNSIKASSDPNLVQIVEKFVVSSDEVLKKKTKTKDFGFFMEELPHGYYGYSDYITEEGMKYLRIMKENIYTAFGVVMLPKGSPFTEKFDKWILRLFDTGIVHKIEVQVILERISHRLQNMIRSSNKKPESESTTLAVRHIQGSLYIYGLGMLLASISFALEILIPRSSPSQ